MKKIIFSIVFLLLTFVLFAQVERHEVVVTNIEVSARVLDGNKFVEDLTIEDFEVYEDDVLQKVEALYLVKKSKIEREETVKRYNPALSRHYYLLFQTTDYNPKMEDAINYFIHQVLQPEDTLMIWTPVKRYNLPSRAIKTMPRETISKEMQKIIRKDTKIGAMQYRDLMKDLKRIVRAISSSSGAEMPTMRDMETDSSSSMFGLEMLLPRYKDTLQKMEDLRIINDKMLIQFANILKRQEGENIVFFFYQREFRPEIQSSTLNKMMSLFQDDPNIMGGLQDLFQAYHRDIEFETDKIKEAFADSSLLFNFIFMNKTPETVSGVYMREQSEDVFSTLSEAAKATGGIIDNSQNPAVGFKNALDTSQYYYILYYSPKNYTRDGKFKRITVKVKNKDYKIKHRVGYYAK